MLDGDTELNRTFRASTSAFLDAVFIGSLLYGRTMTLRVLDEL